MSQTTIQKDAAIRKGSVRVQIGDDFASLVDIGAMRNPVFTSLVENQKIVFDNVDDLKKFVNGKKVQVAFDLAEINLTNMATLDAGLASVTSTAASAVSITDEALGTGWTVGEPIKLANKNGANTIVASIVIKAGGSALTISTDYVTYVGDGENGELGATYIVPVTTNALALTADYDYTPNASKTLAFADFGTKTLKVLRLINTDENGKTFKIDIENGTNFTPVSIDFAGDDEEDVAIMPIQFDGDMVSITDEQQTV